MSERDLLARRFEQQRDHLRAVAYRMLGSLPEAEDAVQDAWLRVSRSDASGIENLSGWLTTITARVCLDALRARRARREDPLDAFFPDPIVSSEDGLDPEQQVLLADSVGLALLVVLEMLDPAERLAFVLHDMFDLPFDEIAPIVGRSPAMARQLASRARRRVRGAEAPDKNVARQREVVDAFFAAAHHGDFDALVAVLDPDVVMRADGGTARAEASAVIRGAAAVARRTLVTAQRSSVKHPVLLNGAAGVVVTVGDQPIAVMAFTVKRGKVVEIDAIVDPERLGRLDLAALQPDQSVSDDGM